MSHTKNHDAVFPERVQTVQAALNQVYGERRWRKLRDPLGELILTILSQNTSDLNSGRAYQALRAAFPHWQAILEAPIEEVYAAIKPAGLGNIKAPRIQNALRSVLERRGEFSLDFLADLAMDDARAWLTSLDGIGPKTAACVLMFALGMPALPVDTHVHRVSLRLELIGPKVSAEKAHHLLEKALQPEQVYGFHMHMIQHGRKVCHAQRPKCEQCPLFAHCNWGQAYTLGGAIPT